MEDYKKKYENALDNFKKIKDANKDNKELVDFIEYEYPELKESEDERIRRELISFFTIENWHGAAPFSAETAKERVAWLEKQGQKPTWSEEDFSILDSIICVVEEWEDSQSEEEKKYYGASTKSDWLKSLKERMKGE